MLTFSALLFISASALAFEETPLALENAEELFGNFAIYYKRQYASEDERLMRLEIFKKNLAEIIDIKNKDPTAGVGINMFSDLTKDEFAEKYLGCLDLTAKPVGPSVNLTQEVSAPPTWDWREQNVVTSVKDQTGCGACWAFATTGVIEAVNARSGRGLVDLSAQQLVDCDRSNNGCQGGSPQRAVQYVVQNGQEPETAYPYRAVQQQCMYNPSQVVARPTRAIPLTLQGEADTKQYLMQYGPIAIALDFYDFQQYAPGKIVTCTRNFIGDKFSHAVLLVGWGEANGIRYWIFKNSYGYQFGEGGYGKFNMAGKACAMYNNPFATGAA